MEAATLNYEFLLVPDLRKLQQMKSDGNFLSHLLGKQSPSFSSIPEKSERRM